MALVKWEGPSPEVYVPAAGKGCKKGNSIEVTSPIASSLLAQGAAYWVAGNVETEELGPPATPLPVPPVAAQKLSSVGVRVTPLIVNANFTTDGVLTKYKVAHKLGTWNVQPTVQTHSGGKAAELTTIAKIVAISQEEIEVTLSAAGAAGVTYWLQIQGTPG